MMIDMRDLHNKDPTEWMAVVDAVAENWLRPRGQELRGRLRYAATRGHVLIFVISKNRGVLVDIRPRG